DRLMVNRLTLRLIDIEHQDLQLIAKSLLQGRQVLADNDVAMTAAWRVEQHSTDCCSCECGRHPCHQREDERA
ncbi:MAG: hypothetical protein J7466_14970, partial [Roseiflexus sp.]|nr:hypothetical protein [Roseiflexus sp.]